jgi:hypothetical protein
MENFCNNRLGKMRQYTGAFNERRLTSDESQVRAYELTVDVFEDIQVNVRQNIKLRAAGN